MKKSIKDFLSLPKKKNQPFKRLIKKIDKLKDEIEIVESDDLDIKEKRCCGKKTYSSYEEAMGDIKTGTRKGSKRPFRAYQCESGNWHLSGVPKHKFKKHI